MLRAVYVGRKKITQIDSFMDRLKKSTASRKRSETH